MSTFNRQTKKGCNASLYKNSSLTQIEFPPSNLNKLSNEDANSLLFRLNYMVLNRLFGGDFYTWYEVLRYSLDFDEETLDFLDY